LSKTPEERVEVVEYLRRHLLMFPGDFLKRKKASKINLTNQKRNKQACRRMVLYWDEEEGFSFNH